MCQPEGWDLVSSVQVPSSNLLSLDSDRGRQSAKYQPFGLTTALEAVTTNQTVAKVEAGRGYRDASSCGLPVRKNRQIELAAKGVHPRVLKASEIFALPSEYS